MLTVHYLDPLGGHFQEIPLRRLKFPGGEEHLAILHRPDVPIATTTSRVRITAHLDSSAEVMALLLLTDALRRTLPRPEIHLNLPYVPYARQDRVANHGEPLSIKVFCDLINAQGYASVYITDPHSDVTGALLDRVLINPSLHEVTTVIDRTAPAALVCPDAGARKKLHAVSRRFPDLPVIFADKLRDTRTGFITGTTVAMPTTPISASPDAPLLVIDDICDGGRTFIELAKALRAQGCPNPLHLYVTHGIFSQGLAPLLEHYAVIHTTRDWTNSANPHVFLV